MNHERLPVSDKLPHIILCLFPLAQIAITQVPGATHYNTGILFEIHLMHKLHEIPFDDNIHSSCPIILKFCTEHGYTAMLCAKFQNDQTIFEIMKIL